MLVEILNADGDFEKVDINEFIDPLIKEYFDNALKYGEDVSKAEARKILFDLATFRANSMPSFAEIKCAEKGWAPFSSSDANTTRQYSFKRGSVLRTVYADTFLEAVKAL